MNVLLTLLLCLQLTILCCATNENMDENCFAESFPSNSNSNETDGFVYLKIVHLRDSDSLFEDANIGCGAPRTIGTEYHNISKNEQLILEYETSTFSPRKLNLLFDGKSVMATMAFLNETENSVNISLNSKEWSCQSRPILAYTVETMVFHFYKIQTRLAWFSQTEKLEMSMVSEIPVVPEAPTTTTTTSTTTEETNSAKSEKSVNILTK